MREFVGSCQSCGKEISKMAAKNGAQHYIIVRCTCGVTNPLLCEDMERCNQLDPDWMVSKNHDNVIAFDNDTQEV